MQSQESEHKISSVKLHENVRWMQKPFFPHKLLRGKIIVIQSEGAFQKDGSICMQKRKETKQAKPEAYLVFRGITKGNEANSLRQML